MTTYQDIHNQILHRCDMGDDFIDEDRALDEMAKSFAELQEILISKIGSNYFIEEHYYDLASGTDTLALPTNFFKLVSLAYSVADGYVDCDPWHDNDKHHGYSRSSSIPAGVYRLSYVPRFQNPASMDDDIPDNFELQNWYEYVVVDCCIKYMTKEESDPSIFMDQKQALIDRITRHAGNRDQGHAINLQDLAMPWGDEWDYAANAYYYNYLPEYRPKYKLHGNSIKLLGKGWW